MSEKHRIPRPSEPTTKENKSRYKEQVVRYCAKEFAKGYESDRVLRRLLKVGGTPAVKKWVSREYLRFLGYSSAVDFLAWAISAFTGTSIALAVAGKINGGQPKVPPALIAEGAVAAVVITVALHVIIKSIWSNTRSPKVDLRTLGSDSAGASEG